MSTPSKENTKHEQSLKVVIRVRPLNNKEIQEGRENIWSIDDQTNIIYANTPNSRKYAFDRIYAPHYKTKYIYTESMSPIINSFINGFNGTIFAYGQTSSGKTYTMMGSAQQKNGVIHRSINTILNRLGHMTNREFSLQVSYLEIYNENIKDLLTPTKQNLKIKQDSFHRPVVGDLTIETITDPEQIFNILNKGMKNRNIGSTKMNDQSSRSHTIFQIHLESKDRVDENSGVRSSILNIVDLAGSERAKKTESSGNQLKEAGHINKSLLTLGIVIKKLSELHIKNNRNSNEHIPYRDSKLTHILEPALGGNSKTIVICTITPADIHLEETVSTLGFASRAKDVKNCATITEIRDDATIIKQQNKKIAQLERKILQMNNGNHDNNNNNNNINIAAIRREYEMKINKLKSICMNPSQNIDIDIDLKSNEDIIKRKKNSILGKRRRHSVSLQVNGSPARKRIKTHIMQNNFPNGNILFATPMNKVKCERDDFQHKLRKVTHISKSLQQELYAKYKDFDSMQSEIDGLNGENKLYLQKLEYYESSVNDNDKDLILQNQELTLKMNELNNELIKYKTNERSNEDFNIKNKLNQELEVSRNTIIQLEEQIKELRLDIEKQHNVTESIRASSVEVSSEVSGGNDVILRLGLHKLQSKLILIKNDKKGIYQILENERQKFNLFKEECEKKMSVYNGFVNGKIDELVNKLNVSEDERRLFESQYHQIREERDELSAELIELRRPENEIIEELQSELLNIQQQCDIDGNHMNNTQNELENKLIEIENLKLMNKELNTSINEREGTIINEYNIKINDLKTIINNLKLLNNKLECDIQKHCVNSISNNKIDNMNIEQLKDLYKNTRRNVKELQTKISAIERKKTVHEKTAQKYTKRCNDLEQRLKSALRDHNNIKTELSKVNKENRSIKYKYNKFQKDIKKYQTDNINNKDLNRKLNLITKRLESLQKKYDIKNNELTQIKSEKLNIIKELNELKNNFSNANNENKKLKKNISNLNDNICELNKEKNNILRDLNTEKNVVNGYENELKKFHQINGQLKIKINELNNNINLYKSDIENLNNKINNLKNNLITNENNIIEKNNKLSQINCELINFKNKTTEKISSLLKQNESLKLNLQTIKNININQRNDIDETNKLLRDSQIELKENKKELIEYQNRWQNERKENDKSIEKLRNYELKMNNLIHESQMLKSSIESKIKEIERLNGEYKLQQEKLLQQIKINADLKIKYENCENNINKLKSENQLLCDEKLRLVKNIEDKENNLCELDKKNIVLNNELSEIQLELNKNQHGLDRNIENLKCELKKLNAELHEKCDIINTWSKKYDEMNIKYELIKKENKLSLEILDTKENEILELNDKIENLYIEFENEKKTLNYKLNKKINDLNEMTNNLCELQTECDELIKKTNIYNKMEIEYNNLIIKNKKCELELNNFNIKYNKCERERELNENKYNNNLKNTMGRLQKITLKNETLKDELNNIKNNNNNRNIYQKKYLEAKEILVRTHEKYERYKNRCEKYETGLKNWENNAIDLKKQIHELQDEIKKLQPTKEKAQAFEQLCKEYHRAATNRKKARLHCRETQTNECLLENYNQENVNNSNSNNKCI